MNNLDRLRQRFDTFTPQTDEDWNRFTAIVEPVTYQKNDFLIQAGQVEQYIYYVAEGMVRLFLNNDGKDISLDFVFSNDFVSAYSSFLTGQPTAFTVQALTDVQAFRFSRTNLLSLYDQSHKAERIGRLIAEQAFLRKTRREVQFLTSNAKQRYVQLLEQHPILVQTISIRHLASYLGIEPESLSRIRREV
ncbi:Crp/Fnr family transcriptional regulator [Spirosoma endophyticum]|uniref:cAMP-binding domain of CRP or a regulatory subunit of cAMP-dependent protein kinases n=1 Tax=Spirosoma endophyticum TaxID=662367 RepID=A0A1I1G5T4_9BACT|nr:Crp/Fnr family transcriptional regulator [Spirosoma endophyticum]SFC04663.1 cAMP-binding domain of CRP or a regulatory subunit of cAMP-dependent protein kinases [Spirosoma endophyticum]